MALSPQEQKELERLELEQLEAEYAALAEAPNLPTGERVNQPVQEEMPVLMPGLGFVRPQAFLHGVKNLGLEAGGSAVGQAIGAGTGVFAPVAVPALGALGGLAGYGAAVATDPEKDFSLGEAAGAFLGGAIPGASLAKAGGKAILKAGAKQAAGNVAATNVQSLVEGHGMASIPANLFSAVAGFAAPGVSKFLDKGKVRAESIRAFKEGAPLRSVLREGRELGLVTPPAATRKTAAQKFLHAAGGGTDVVNAMQEINAPKILQAVRDDLGIKPGQPLDERQLNSIAFRTNAIWEEIGSAGNKAKDAMEKFKMFNAKASEEYRAYRGSQVKDPMQLAKAKAFEAEADAAEKELRKAVPADLFERFTEARRLRAKAELVREGLSPGGRIDPNVFADASEQGRKLDGNFAKIGRWQREFNRYAASETRLPSGHALSYIGRFAPGAGAGYAVGSMLGLPPAGALGLAVGGAAIAPPVTRRFLSSPLGQRMAVPDYGRMGADLPAEIGRLSALGLGRPNLPKDNKKN